MKPRNLNEIMRRTTGRARNGSSRTIRHLSRIIRDEEEVVAASPAKYKGEFGIILISSHRILFCTSRLFGDVSVIEFGLNAVNTVSYRIGLTSGSVGFRIAKDDVLIERLSRRATTKVADSIQRAKDTPADLPAFDIEETDDELARVERLHQLLQCGALDPDEYRHLKLKAL